MDYGAKSSHYNPFAGQTSGKRFFEQLYHNGKKSDEKGIKYYPSAGCDLVIREIWQGAAGEVVKFLALGGCIEGYSSIEQGIGVCTQADLFQRSGILDG